MPRLGYGYGGDAYPGETAQYQNDHAPINDREPIRQNHDEPVEPGSGEYKFFYGGGQLHVSPTHEHDELRGHAGIDKDHTGPTAVGYVNVDRGRANWQAGGNVSMRGLHRVFKDYSKQVGWQWGGLTDLEGQPINDDFAPKKKIAVAWDKGHLYVSTNEQQPIRGRQPDVVGRLIIMGKTAYVGPRWIDDPERFEALQEWAHHEGYRLAERDEDYYRKVAEYPGGGNMTQMMDNYSPMGEDLEMYNRGTNDGHSDQSKEDVPTGTFKCPDCGEIFHRWNAYLLHRKSEEPNVEPTQDGKFPEAPDMDVPLPNNWSPRQPNVFPLASVKDAERYEEFDDYADILGIRGDYPDLHHYGAFRGGECVGVASVQHSVIHYLGGRTALDRGSLLVALQHHHGSLDASDDDGVSTDYRTAGFVRTASGFHWAAGQHPKDQIDRPLPFIYDVQKDVIVVGQPGARHSDIPGEFTPGGIVEGEYLPGGKVHIHTMTNVPYTVRHMLDLWYWSHPHMEVVGVELHDAAGNKTKLARRSKTDVGHYIRQIAATDPAAWNAYQSLSEAGGKVYVVGGAVRDALLQKEPKDIDLMVTGIPAEKVHQILAGMPGKVDLTGKDFGVYRYRTRGHEVEVALPRTERSTGDRRVDFDVQVDHNLPVEDDLLRRDFTVNAMAVDLDSGSLVDPYGGATDIEERKLRTVHPSSFEEDPTRMLRGLVASSRHGLTPTEDTRQQMATNGHRLDGEARERVQAELDKLFKSAHPAGAIRLGHDTGILKHIFPEVEHNFDFDQNNPHHKLPLGEHLLNVLEGVSEHSTDPDLRLAALLHDIGKPASAWTNPETGKNHYYKGADGQGQDHETVGAGDAERRMRELKYPVARIKRVQHLIQHHMFPAFSGPKGARKFIHRVGDEHADDLLALRYADQRGKGQSPEQLAARTHVDSQRELVEHVRSKQEPTNQSAISINGNDIISLGVKPGPEVGRILRQLTEDVVEDPRLNDPALLKQRAQEYINAT